MQIAKRQSEDKVMGDIILVYTLIFDSLYSSAFGDIHLRLSLFFLFFNWKWWWFLNCLLQKKSYSQNVCLWKTRRWWKFWKSWRTRIWLDFLESNKVEIEENQWGLGIRILDSQLKRALVISSLFEWQFFVPKCTELRNSKMVSNPPVTLRDLEWPCDELISTVHKECVRYYLWFYLKTDVYDWTWKRFCNVMRSLDVKHEVTVDHFRFEIPRKHLTMIFMGTFHNSLLGIQQQLYCYGP